MALWLWLSLLPMYTCLHSKAPCSLCPLCIISQASFISDCVVGVTLQIISQTAKFVRGKGIQVEVKLRVQQAGNPKFDFLNTQDRLYPYYRCDHCTAGYRTSPCSLHCTVLSACSYDLQPAVYFGINFTSRAKVELVSLLRRPGLALGNLEALVKQAPAPQAVLLALRLSASCMTSFLPATSLRPHISCCRCFCHACCPLGG